jgi:hypothetical protein
MVIDTHYDIGEDVVHFTGLGGRITAIHLRAGHACYEMTYMNDNGPASVNVEECEISKDAIAALGFVSKKKAQ